MNLFANCLIESDLEAVAVRDLRRSVPGGRRKAESVSIEHAANEGLVVGSTAVWTKLVDLAVTREVSYWYDIYWPLGRVWAGDWVVELVELNPSWLKARAREGHKIYRPRAGTAATGLNTTFLFPENFP